MCYRSSRGMQPAHMQRTCCSSSTCVACRQCAKSQMHLQHGCLAHVKENPAMLSGPHSLPSPASCALVCLIWLRLHALTCSLSSCAQKLAVQPRRHSND